MRRGRSRGPGRDPGRRQGHAPQERRAQGAPARLRPAAVGARAARRGRPAATRRRGRGGSPGADAVEAAFAGRGLRFVRQEPPLGTGHALLTARDPALKAARARCSWLNGDVPLLRARRWRALLEPHRSRGAAATLLSAGLDDPGAYGRVLRRPDGCLRAIVEAHDASAEVGRSGRSTPAATPSRSAPCSGARRPAAAERPGGVLPHRRLCVLVAAAAAVSAVALRRRPAGPRRQHPGRAGRSGAAAARRGAPALLDAGAVIEDPATTHVGLDVEVEADAVIRPFTLLEGARAWEPGPWWVPSRASGLRRSGPGAQVLDHCLLRECVVEAGASVGPFAHMRPQSRIGPRAPGRQLRGAEEDPPGRGLQGPAPVLPRRRHDRPGREHRGRHDHLQLRRRRQAPHAHRGRRVRGQRHDPRGAGHDRRGRLRRRRQHDHRGRAAACPRPGRAAWPVGRARPRKAGQRRAWRPLAGAIRKARAPASHGLRTRESVAPTRGPDHVRHRRIRRAARRRRGDPRGPAAARVPRLRLRRRRRGRGRRCSSAGAPRASSATSRRA